MKEQNVFIKDAKSNIIPAIYVPINPGRTVVLISHGLMGDKNEYLNTSARLASAVADKGLSSLRIDYYGHGDSDIPLDDFCFASQIDNLISSLHWLKNAGYKRVVCVGISFGAPPVLELAELYPEIVTACVLIAPVLDYQKTFVQPITDWGHELFGYEKIVRCIHEGGLYLDDNYKLSTRVLLDILNMDVPRVGVRVHQPIIIFHGNRDNMVPIEASKEFAERFNNAKFIVMNNTEHGITEVGDEVFQTKTTINNLHMIVDEVGKL